MNVSLGIIGVSPRITITTPSPKGELPSIAMRKARQRYASQGARLVTLVPRRSGEGWVTKKEK